MSQPFFFASLPPGQDGIAFSPWSVSRSLSRHCMFVWLLHRHGKGFVFFWRKIERQTLKTSIH